MCNVACLQFGQSQLAEEDVRGKIVLEVGSRNVNGSLRSFVESLSPVRYIGVDVQSGPGVDEVCQAENLQVRFGDAAFDLLISTEMVEHVRDWRRVIANLKSLLRPNGVVLLTTRSHGFPYHGYPHDYWRYELADMREIFSDFRIENLVPDPSEPGVLIKARKPVDYAAKDLSAIALYSMIVGKRVREISPSELLAFRLATWRERWREEGSREFVARYWRAPLARVRHAIANAQRAPLPFGCVDIPRPGDEVSGVVHLAGWALCDDPIVEIAIYVDRHFAALGRLHGNRPDVKRAFPQYPYAETSGWSAHLDLTPGPHDLTVQALTSKGAIATIGSVQVGKND